MSRGLTAATGNWYCGLFEPSEMGFLLHLLRKEDHFLDIGANIGSYTVLAAGAVGTRTTAVEPIESTMRHLRNNLLANHIQDSVASHCCGISSEIGSARFTTKLGAENHILPPDATTDGVILPVTTIDHLTADDPPTAIKIDVEGYEYQALLGAQRVLSSPKLLAIVVETLNHGTAYGHSTEMVFTLLARHGFMPMSYEPKSRKLTKATSTCDNTIFVRDESVVAQRLHSAPRFRLVNGTI